jgi:hypothetical protein
MKDWKHENWLDVKSENVRKIMTARIEYARQQGCNAGDPDNIDGYVSSFPPSFVITIIYWLRHYLPKILHVLPRQIAGHTL